MSHGLARLLLATGLLVAASACGGGAGSPADSATGSICSDGLDNDGDGSTDYPADPGCDDAADTDETNPPIAQCSDGRDNDADGKIDFPNDPGCFTQLQATEIDDCPNGDHCPACGNGVDDDHDNLTDYGQDDGCASAAGRDEWGIDPNACGAGLTVTRLDLPLVEGMVPGAPSNLMSSLGCGGTGGEAVYQLVLDEPHVVVLTTDLPQTTANTVLYVRSDCLVPSTEVGCNDDAEAAVEQSTLTVSLTAGRWFVIVDNRIPGTPAPFALRADLYAGEGTACTDSAECGPGLQCRIPIGGTTMICTDPVCNDGVDDDSDGANDFPDDPGCDAPTDFDEFDDCPAGVNCPACGNDLDDDGDTQIDYPNDVDCASASQPVEGCSTETDPILVQTTSSSTGSTSGAANNFFPSCDFSSGGPDVVTLVNLPAMSQFHVDLGGTGFDAVLAMHDQSCANEVGCNNSFSIGGETLDLSNLAAGAYAIVVDGYFGGSGSFTTNISGTIAPLGHCDGVLADNGVIQCGVGYACIGGVCLGNLQCNNGLDDDGDGDTDYPNDPGCGGPTDTTEADNCPGGAMCPECANATDDDGDLQIDYPADSDCSAASDDSEESPACTFESDPVLTFTSGALTGTTVGATDDIQMSCDFGFGNGADVVAVATLPAMQDLHVDAMGTTFDSVLALRNPACTTPDLGCEDFGGLGLEGFDLTNLPAGDYSVIVDGYNGLSGSWTTNISGTIAPGGECSGVLASAGAISCPTGYNCTGGHCLGSLKCNNGMDDDGDSKIDYPNDPGCTTPTDNSEGDTCPGGASCPDCSNGMDDDGDSQTDYPADTSCIAASGASEGTCGQDAGGVVQVVIPLYAGTTVGGVDDFTPTCAFNSPSQDRAFALTLPVTVADLQVDTIGSTFDTVLSVMDSACTTPLACDDQGGGGFGTSLLHMLNVAPGQYGIIVDGWSGDGNYNLNIRGTVAPNSVCTGTLFSTGVLVCPANHICTGGTCQPI